MTEKTIEIRSHPVKEQQYNKLNQSILVGIIETKLELGRQSPRGGKEADIEILITRDLEISIISIICRVSKNRV